MAASESAAIVPVPEAESAVGEFRAELDPSARCGVPAHVTVIYPLLPPDRLDRNARRLLGHAVPASSRRSDASAIMPAAL